VSGKKSIIVPAGLPIQSKPGPGEKPQVFEVDAAAVAAPASSSIAADLPPDNSIGSSVLLAGTVKSVKADDRLLLMKKGWNGVQTDYAVVTVQSVDAEKDPRGKTNTRVTFQPSLGGSPITADFR